MVVPCTISSSLCQRCLGSTVSSANQIAPHEAGAGVVEAHVACSLVVVAAVACALIAAADVVGALVVATNHSTSTDIANSIVALRATGAWVRRAISVSPQITGKVRYAGIIGGWQCTGAVQPFNHCRGS